jgi:hypothetical protein
MAAQAYSAEAFGCQRDMSLHSSSGAFGRQRATVIQSKVSGLSVCVRSKLSADSAGSLTSGDGIHKTVTYARMG